MMRLATSVCSVPIRMRRCENMLPSKPPSLLEQRDARMIRLLSAAPSPDEPRRQIRRGASRPQNRRRNPRRNNVERFPHGDGVDGNSLALISNMEQLCKLTGTAGDAKIHLCPRGVRSISTTVPVRFPHASDERYGAAASAISNRGTGSKSFRPRPSSAPIGPLLPRPAASAFSSLTRRVQRAYTDQTLPASFATD